MLCLLHRKDKDFTLIFKHCWGYSTCQISDGSTWYLRYWVHGFELRVDDSEGMGYLVLRVWGTLFPRYWGTGYGVRSFSLTTHCTWPLHLAEAHPEVC